MTLREWPPPERVSPPANKGSSRASKADDGYVPNDTPLTTAGNNTNNVRCRTDGIDGSDRSFPAHTGGRRARIDSYRQASL